MPVFVRDDELATPTGGELLITANLHAAIWQIRQSGEYHILWADAICINQGDILERNQQIQIMIDIYKAATLVLIWIGLSDETSDMMFDWMRYVTVSGQLFPPQALETSDGKHDSRSVEQPWKSEWTKRTSVEETIAMSRTFTSRPWWKRRWIIQELVFARSAYVFCGARSIS
jgi:hypothetical protein